MNTNRKSYREVRNHVPGRPQKRQSNRFPYWVIGVILALSVLVGAGIVFANLPQKQVIAVETVQPTQVAGPTITAVVKASETPTSSTRYSYHLKFIGHTLGNGAFTLTGEVFASTDGDYASYENAKSALANKVAEAAPQGICWGTTSGGDENSMAYAHSAGSVSQDCWNSIYAATGLKPTDRIQQALIDELKAIPVVQADHDQYLYIDEYGTRFIGYGTLEPRLSPCLTAEMESVGFYGGEYFVMDAYDPQARKLLQDNMLLNLAIDAPVMPHYCGKPEFTEVDRPEWLELTKRTGDKTEYIISRNADGGIALSISVHDNPVTCDKFAHQWPSGQYLVEVTDMTALFKTYKFAVAKDNTLIFLDARKKEGGTEFVYLSFIDGKAHYYVPVKEHVTPKIAFLGASSFCPDGRDACTTFIVDKSNASYTVDGEKRVQGEPSSFDQ